MARKRTQAHRDEIDNTREGDRNPHAGMPPEDLSEQTRPRSPEDPAAELPASVEAERGRYPGLERGARGLPESDRPFAAKPVDRLAADPPPRPEYREEPEGDRPPYTILARQGDIAAAELEAVQLDAAHPADPDAPVSGEEGGAPLLEETDQKHNPRASWPGPTESLAAAPTPSPAAGPEPSFQYHPPQDIEFEDKPEAAAGVATEQAQPKREDEETREKRFSTKEPEPPRKQSDDSVRRDEAGQVSIDQLAEKALEGVVGLYKGADEEPEPYRLQKALELAARRIMSPAYWSIRERFFVSRETQPDGSEPEAAAA
jgi:hypothetical protein